MTIPPAGGDGTTTINVATITTTPTLVAQSALAASATPSLTLTPSSGGSGGLSKPVMAAAITAPVVAVALAGIGIIFLRRRVTWRNRNSVPYDEEFEILKKKHDEKFGPAHNY